MRVVERNRLLCLFERGAELEARLSLRDLEGASSEDEWLDRGAADLRVTVAVATAAEADITQVAQFTGTVMHEEIVVAPEPARVRANRVTFLPDGNGQFTDGMGMLVGKEDP